MSGITKAMILTLTTLMLFTNLSLNASEVEKSAKSRIIKITEKSDANSAMTERKLSDNNQSVRSSGSASKLTVERRSNYKDISDPGLILQKQSSMKLSTLPKGHQKIRDSGSSAQLMYSGFYISSVDVSLYGDFDSDGYSSEFTINFDADTDYSSATVYALLYISYEGGPWELYYETDYFNIYGWSSSDNLSVSTILTSGYPSGRYDVLIDLYDEYDNALVATLSSYDTYALADLYLEDTSYESASDPNAVFSIYDASITLLSDNDDDGYFHSFSLQFDADVVSGEAQVYAEIWVRDDSGNWQLDYTTEDFLIEGNSTLDTFILETQWESGYSTDYYDFRVELYDAYTYDLLASSNHLDQYLFQVPLEDITYDSHPTSGGSGGVVITSVSYESGGGGSMGLFVMCLTLLISLIHPASTITRALRS
ncbi:MAG: hypothetical protein GY808_01915 [Gammaproteobacteria bacterium]|nr:hypothetical protein [Gammaproteobacteria bacterium]